MKYLSLMVVLLVAHAASAQDWAQAALQKSPRHREWVTVKHGDRSVETFVAYPESKDKRPVVVVIHEIFGMTDWVEDLSDQIAAAGYIAGKPYDPLTYDGAGHGFMRAGEAPDASEANKKARGDSWVRLKSPLDKN